MKEDPYNCREPALHDESTNQDLKSLPDFCGYRSLVDLQRVFKARTGETLGEFRRHARWWCRWPALAWFVGFIVPDLFLSVMGFMVWLYVLKYQKGSENEKTTDNRHGGGNSRRNNNRGWCAVDVHRWWHANICKYWCVCFISAFVLAKRKKLTDLSSPHPAAHSLAIPKNSSKM